MTMNDDCSTVGMFSVKISYDTLGAYVLLTMKYTHAVHSAKISIKWYSKASQIVKSLHLI